MKRIGCFFVLLVFLSACTKQEGNLIKLETSLGDIRIRLYDETPLHRDNFKKLVKAGFYDGMLFHRVIADFMVQAGDPDSKNARRGQRLGTGAVNYTLKSEFNPKFFHKRGALAAARESDNVNPERNSNGSHFYISQGKVFSPEELEAAVETINEKRHKALFELLQEKRKGEIARYQLVGDTENLMRINKELSEETRKQFDGEKLVLSDEQKNVYTTIGGIPHLDGAYTVFGEVTEGMEVVDKIAALKTDENNRPFQDVIIYKMKNEK